MTQIANVNLALPGPNEIIYSLSSVPEDEKLHGCNHMKRKSKYKIHESLAKGIVSVFYSNQCYSMSREQTVCQWHYFTPCDRATALCRTLSFA